MTRDEFREAVFARDGHRCVVCRAPAQDAHHIVERRLFEDGGYDVDNGASLCGSCHMKAETTELSCEDIRRAAGITRVVLPDHLYADAETPYDKWGNIILPSGRRLPGELFYDGSVQKVLAPYLDLFDERVRYPRTMHVPFSPGVGKDDRVLPSLAAFVGHDIVVTLKLDGENTSIYPDGYTHARSPDSRSHPTRDWVKAFAARIGPELPRGWRLCGENMWAQHSIRYDDLDDYFYGFSIWDDTSRCLGWDETLTWFGLLDVTPVPVLYEGPYAGAGDLEALHALGQEGWVMRTRDGFSLREFRTHVAKYVRENHVQTAKHWFHGQRIERNALKGP